MSSITVVQNGHLSVLNAPNDKKLLDFLRENGFIISAPCGGNGTCGKCKVRLIKDGRAAEVLACGCRAEAGCTVILPDKADNGLICTDGTGGGTAVTAGRDGLGAAVDLGTTTVAIKLFDLSDGRELGTKSAWSQQAPYGADVISRCQYTMEREEGLAHLSGLIQTQIISMVKSLCDENSLPFSRLSEIYLAGNTVMEHIFAGLSPASIALSPFTPLSLFDSGEALVVDGIKIYLAPCVAGYVGGDITAGLLSAGLLKKEGQYLFIDVGTNGEMAIGGRDGFICCAVASGPAFEGAGISCGMASTEGAVNHVSWDGERFCLEVIGGTAPRGICGSGLIDLLSLLVEYGLVDEGGLLLPPDDAPEGFEAYLDEDENGNGLLFLTDDDSLYFTAGDVRQLQLAKAAVAAGISVLMGESGLDFEDIDALYLAGGFGSHMSAEGAVTIGMLPRVLLDKIVCVGNTSLSGACMALLSQSAAGELMTIQKSCRYLELSGNTAFNEAFPMHMSFDEEELEWN